MARTRAGDWGATLRGVASTRASLQLLEERWVQSAKWVVGSDVEYAAYVEFGTSKMAAQPYLRPALEEARRGLDQIADGVNSLSELIAAIALKVERTAKQIVPVDTGTLKASIRAQKV